MNNEKFRTLAAEAFSLEESTYDAAKAQLTVTVIKPGFSKNQTKGRQRYYPAETLKRDHKVFEGAKMFVDHATEAENKARPEGSVHNWVATLGSTWAEADGTVKGTATVIDPGFKSKLDRLKEAGQLQQMAISSRHAAEVSQQQIEGQDAMYMESLLAVRSVDFVTYAGAGGQVEAMESASDAWDVDVISEKDFRKRRPDIVSVIESAIKGENETMKSLEEQLQEASTQLAAARDAQKAAETKFAESDKAARKATVAVELAKQLTESKLPEKAQERLRKQFADAVVIDGIKEAITFEADYVKSFSSGTQVRGLGASHNASEGAQGERDPKTMLKESAMAAGLNEKDAQIFAEGRR
jgi:hypothetical protein